MVIQRCWPNVNEYERQMRKKNQGLNTELWGLSPSKVKEKEEVKDP